MLIHFCQGYDAEERDIGLQNDDTGHMEEVKLRYPCSDSPPSTRYIVDGLLRTPNAPYTSTMCGRNTRPPSLQHV